MAVSKRGKTRLVLEGRDYFWEVLPKFDPNDQHPVLTVVSDDKKILLYYPLSQFTHLSFLEFLDSKNYSTPPPIPNRIPRESEDHNIGWGKSDFVVTPKFVRQLVFWAHENNIEKIPNNWR